MTPATACALVLLGMALLAAGGAWGAARLLARLERRILERLDVEAPGEPEPPGARSLDDDLLA